MQRLMAIDSILVRFAALGLDGRARFSGAPAVKSDGSRVDQRQLRGARKGGLVRVRINSQASLTEKVLAIVERLRVGPARKRDTSSQVRMLLALTRSFTKDDHFDVDAVYLSYVENMKLSNMFMFEVTDPTTDEVRASFTIHMD